MQKMIVLYQKTKDSLTATNHNQPDHGIQLIREVQHQIRCLKVDNPELADELSTLEVIAYNNLACAYNKKGKYRAGLFNLQQAQLIESQIFPDIAMTRSPDTLYQVATTHSNLCAILSQMGEHERALKEIESAISLLLRTKQTSESDSLIVFFYNSAIECEYLNKLNDGKKQAEQGYSISKGNFEMRKKLGDVISRMEEKIRVREEKIGKYLISQYKSKTMSNSQHKIRYDTGNQKVTSKKLSIYQTKIPQAKLKKGNGFPVVRLPHSLRSYDQIKDKAVSLGLDSRQNTISLYQTSPIIPKKNQHSLSRKKNFLRSIGLEEYS